VNGSDTFFGRMWTATFSTVRQTPNFTRFDLFVSWLCNKQQKIPNRSKAYKPFVKSRHVEML